MGTIRIALYYLLDIIAWMIVIKSLMTWFPNGRQSKIFDILENLTEPIEGPIRSIMYKYTNGPIDFSPLIAIVLLMFLRQLVLIIF
ncbi:TPA: YggT family protein [Clostridioides difficile]|uniref:YggT family protein n=1 Tax=Clostridioides difficile TaxID=1496 RepID=UPI00038D3EB7|nr:YggT family protein [Clostridioides difficile]EGT3781909.1 YggT family protein [Clostridioides difficile]EGT4673389.1 YggT family protein [Clostridioides difficile]EGT5074509.1 YggT family protein [Clostridioides difficile]EKS6834993.1 YggT family protein [Clostridioides difficile]ELX4515248.1 YggT family protein [Clostridioides difficile]